MNKLYLGDCLKIMDNIEDKSIDLIICDLPYGITSCKWDIIIPFDELWNQYNRIIKDKAAILLFGNEPFSSMLRMSNIKNYKYDWYWNKCRGSGFQIVKYRPLSKIETISVFCKNSPNYYPILKLKKKKTCSKIRSNSESNPLYKIDGKNRINYYDYPSSLIEFSKQDKERIHPTQKPVKLLEYLIKTYTKENELVLDNCMGSGSTIVAAILQQRKYIEIEKEEKYFNIAKDRIERTIKSNTNKLDNILF